MLMDTNFIILCMSRHFKLSPCKISKPDLLGKEVIIVRPVRVPPAIPMADDTKKEDDVQEIISGLTDTWDKRYGSVGYMLCSVS